MAKTVIVAVSGGPDSMALLDILHKQEYKCLVAHVNYGVRETANRDQKIVEDYCQQHQLEFLLHKAKKVETGNFQAIARKIRYDFLINLSNNCKTSDVYVAHHQDDVLETYIMQNKRNITPQYYGIKDKIEYKSINIIRPLLDYSKDDLVNYCIENKVQYGIDESNLEENYKRNKIRHNIVNKMTKNDKELMLKEIEDSNKQLKKDQNNTSNLYYAFAKNHHINYILNLQEKEAVDVLRLWFKKNKIFNISDSEYLNIIDYLKATSNNKYLINTDYSLFKDYDKITLSCNHGYEYSYTFNHIVYKDYKHFSIKDTGTSFEAVTVKESDFPLTIRSFKDGDTILMRYGSKRISRWFIDNKIAPSKRRSWPILLNKNNEVILVPQIGCNVARYSNNPNMFVVI